MYKDIAGASPGVEERLTLQLVHNSPTRESGGGVGNQCPPKHRLICTPRLSIAACRLSTCKRATGTGMGAACVPCEPRWAARRPR